MFFQLCEANICLFIPFKKWVAHFIKKKWVAHNQIIQEHRKFNHKSAPNPQSFKDSQRDLQKFSPRWYIIGWKLLPKLISPLQNVFFKSRLITDNISLTDLIHQVHIIARNRGKKLAVLKLDFLKTFDRFSGPFIEAIFCLEFNFLWNDWATYAMCIQCCI